MTDEIKKKEGGVSRRDFLKIGGAAAAGLQIGAVAGAGLAAGKDPAANTGWQHLGDNTQFVDRKPLQLKGQPYEKVGPVLRPEEVESAFGRRRLMMKSMKQGSRGSQKPAAEAAEKKTAPPKDGPPEAVGDIPPESRPGAKPSGSGKRKPGPPRMKMPPPDSFVEPLAGFYKTHPDIYELDKVRLESIMPKRREDEAKYGDFYTLINAWQASWMAGQPIEDPPEISDFQMASPMGRGRKIRPSIPFKSPQLAAKLVKKVAHHFGATMVGVTKLKPEWCYNHSLRGSEDRGSYEVPKHWKYVIAFGVPHQWEQVQANPNCGTSFDAYSRATIAARRLETFIKSLGYPARRHSPMDGYDLIAVPILVDAGLGQQGRHGIVITPETGSNFRAAFVTTNLPMEIDKPIDFGVNEFCKDCHICAEICPSASISYEETNEKITTRGYRHWEINQTSCYNFWMQSMGGLGCRLCLIACPYSRKNNWAHALARTVDTNDPTGLVNDGLTWMQKTFFKTPEAAEYLPPPDGRFATFREPPDWLSVKEYLDIKTLDPTKGE
ncbi:MAG: reductive dehalogenase [Candidatus Aminicenantes bacterium]|nr:reductive dehalogenase [Candidatus Aminicenantes bacterium]